MSKKLSNSVFVHESAIVESTDIGENTRIWGFSHILAGAKIGSDCNICSHVFAESGSVVGNNVTVKNGVSLWDKVTIEDEVFVGPHAVFTNDLRPRAFKKITREQFIPTTIKRGASIGAGAVIVCGITVGEYAFIAAGAVVTKDVPAHGLIKGNPGRVEGWVCKCAGTVFSSDNSDESCTECGMTRADIT